VALVTPFDSLTAVAQLHFPWLPVRWLLNHPFDSLSAAPRLGMPVIVLAGERDTLIPPAHARRLYEAWGAAKRSNPSANPSAHPNAHPNANKEANTDATKAWHLLPGADHNNIGEHPDFVRLLRAFFANGGAP
jgi:pimeloyl-ACP methyl ester carboxylesterase